MPKDLDQSAKMVNMRIKIDVWTRGLDESFREKVRENLRELFCQLPPRRVWYYLKRIRYMLLRGRTTGSQLDSDDLSDGPEDVFVNGKYHFQRTPHCCSVPDFAIVSHLFRTNDLCRLMHFATLNHIRLIQNPDFDLAAEITLDEDGAKRLMLIKSLVFESSGKHYFIVFVG